jgi:hypothetical protein
MIDNFLFILLIQIKHETKLFAYLRKGVVRSSAVELLMVKFEGSFGGLKMIQFMLCMVRGIDDHFILSI